jgi:hypothetical protein
MRLTDEQIAELRDDMKPGFYIPPWDIPLPDTIHALATEVLESRALLDEDRLTDIITDSIDLDWTPRDAAKAIVRAMGGDNP